ncbi:MAG: YbjN domain-containing protein [Anaerolineae bacterium]|nr:YbjN domain-containing protein [Anaerolineae bacterium]
MNLATLETFLQEYGWDYEIQGAVLATGFKGETNVFRVFIQPTEAWVLLAIVPFTPQPASECAARFCAQLARLNYELNLAKLCADADGDVALLMELPAADLTYAQIALALDALCYYADTYYLPLLNLARDLAYVWPEEAEL